MVSSSRVVTQGYSLFTEHLQNAGTFTDWQAFSYCLGGLTLLLLAINLLNLGTVQ